MSLFVLKSKKYASFSDEKVLKSANSSFNWKKKKLNIEICGLSWPGNSRDIRGAFSAGLLESRNCTVFWSFEELC